MGSRLKEEEKNEKAIRNLLRKGANRRCINCNSLGPQYVCLNFWTFVCTQCSGIHREFTHRVKSVSMSKFTSQEVTSLENGGNERGREIYFKDWDSQRQPLPDSSNVDRVRDFIKMVYVDRRFSGERPLPRRGGDREDNHDNRRPEPRPNYRADSRSPPYEDRYDDRASGARRSNFGQDERRYDDRGIRYDEKRSPGRFEIDRNRYDRSYNDNRRYDDRFRYDNRDRHYEDRYNEGLDRRFEERFANERGNRDHGGSSPPPIRPVKEILGEDVPPLRVEDHGNHSNGSRDLDKSNRSQDGRGQRFGSSSSFGSVDGSGPPVAPSIKRENSASLIDFMAEPEPSAVREQTDPFGLTTAVQPSASNSSSTGWATFDMSSATSGPAAPLAPGASTASVPVSSQGLTGGFDAFPNQPNGNAQWATQWPAMPTASVPPSLESTADDWTSLVGPSASVGSSQPWSSFPAAPATTHVATSHVQVTQEASNANNSAGAISQALQGQKSSRPEIPSDLFSAPQPGLQLPGARFGPPYVAAGGMGMQVGSYNRPPSISRNPFDLPGDSSMSAAAGEFPSLGPLQAALPNMNIGSMTMPGSGLSGFGHQWNQTNTLVPPPVSYPPAAMSSVSGYYGGQTLPNALPQAMQGPGPSSMGMGMPGGFVTAPKQGMDSLFPLQSASQFPSQSAYGAATDFPSQGAAVRIPLQNPVGSSGTDALFAGQSGQRLTSYGSLGSLNSLPSGTDPLFPTQPLVQGGQRLMSQGSLGSLSSISGPDSHFGPQPPSQFPTQSSLGSVGNPFG